MTTEKLSLSNAQYALYMKAMHGLRAYSKEERIKLDEEDVRTIEYIHEQSKKQLNRLKQKALTNTLAGNILKMWRDIPYTSSLGILLRPIQDDRFFVKNLTFEQLGISRKTIINTLISCGSLTPYFFNIK